MRELAWPAFQQVQFVFASYLSLVFLLVVFVGLLSWLTYMAVTQRKILKKFVTKEELHQAFEEFRREIKNG